MLRYKGFDSALFADDMARFEDSVNAWLQVNRPHIRMMAQSARGTHVVVSFIYDSSDAKGRSGRSDEALAPFQDDDDDEADELSDDTLDDAGLPEAELPY